MDLLRTQLIDPQSQVFLVNKSAIMQAEYTTDSPANCRLMTSARAKGIQNFDARQAVRPVAILICVFSFFAGLAKDS